MGEIVMENEPNSQNSYAFTLILLSYRLHLCILFLLLLRIRASQSTLNERGVIVGLWVGSGGEWTKPQTPYDENSIPV